VEREEICRNYTILVKFAIGETKVISRYIPFCCSFSKQDHEIIDREWKAAIGISKKKGTPLYNGKLYTLRKWEYSNGKLLIELSDTNYKEYVGTRSAAFLARHSFEQTANPLAVCACAITSDGKIVVARRKNVDVNNNKFHVIGGFVDPERDYIKQCPNVFHAIKREISEEVNVSLDDFCKVRCLGLVHNNLIPHSELVFMAKLGVASSQISINKSFEKEMGRIEFLEDNSTVIKNFVLANDREITPTGQANLLLYSAISRKQSGLQI
jgi:hypothetical protein